jgi:myo-inositol catabolism protein IolS
MIPALRSLIRPKGKSEELFARALGSVRPNICIATKASPGDFAPADLKRACEKRLRALRTDWIDLYQLHWPNWNIPLADTLGALEELKQSGKIRAYGVSNFGRQDLSEGIAGGFGISGNQIAYNLIFRAIEFEILPLCVRENIPVLCYSPIMQGLLSDSFSTAAEVPDDRARTRHFSRNRKLTRHGEAGAEAETFAAIEAVRAIARETGESTANVSMAWLLAQKGVASVIVGGRNARQVTQNVRAGLIQLPDSILTRLSEATEPLKQKLGPNADLWQADSRLR